MRDEQLVIRACENNTSPVLRGFNNSVRTSTDFCTSYKRCVTINAFDADTADKVMLTWQHDLPKGVTFTLDTTSSNQPFLKLCWQPSDSVARKAPYHLLVEATDNKCPLNGRASRSYIIHAQKQPEPQFSAIPDSCGYVKFSINNPQPGWEYSWAGVDGWSSSLKSFRRQFRNGGSYIYKLDALSPGLCVYTFFDTVTVPHYLNPKIIAPSDVCKGTITSVQLAASGGKGPLLLKWKHLPPNGPQPYLFTFSITKDTTFTYTVTDGGGKGCSITDSVTIRAREPLAFRLPKDTTICSDVLFLDAKTLALSPHELAKAQWKELATGDTVSNRLNLLRGGRYTLSSSSIYGCKAIDTVNITIAEAATAYSTDTTVCENTPFQLTGGPTNQELRMEMVRKRQCFN